MYSQEDPLHHSQSTHGPDTHQLQGKSDYPDIQSPNLLPACEKNTSALFPIKCSEGEKRKYIARNG